MLYYKVIVCNTMAFNRCGCELIDVVLQFNVASVVDWITNKVNNTFCTKASENAL